MSASDSARQLQARTVGLLFDQDTLSVPDMQAKYRMQLAGLGFGFLLVCQYGQRQHILHCVSTTRKSGGQRPFRCRQVIL